MIEGLIFGLIVITGLGTLFPRIEPGIGFTLFMGSILIPLTLLIGTTFLGLPLFWIGLSIIGIAASNLIRVFSSATYRPKDGWVYFFFHPGFVLPAFILFTGMFTDYASYLLWNNDEFSSWGGWAKQIFVSDTSWREDMNTLRHYPKGWPLAVAFAQLPFGDYDEFRGIALLALFHVALLALTFDVIRLIIEKELDIPAKISYLLSWSIILVIISIESSWKLLPPSLLIERPVMYWSIGLFVLALMAWYRDKPQSTILIGMGLTLASALALKTPTMSLAIPIALIGLMYWKMSKANVLSKGIEISFIKIAALLFIPLMVIASLWYLHSHKEGINVGFPVSFGDGTQAKISALSGLIIATFLDYLGSYKTPLTILGLIGLLSALFYPRQRSVVIALFIFITFSWIGLWPLYMFNIHGNELEALPSFQRYTRLPIRLIHYLGATLFAINFFTILKSKEFSLSQKLLKQNFLITYCFVLILFFGAFQVWSINKSYLDMGMRVYGSTTTDLSRAARIKKFRTHSETINSLIRNFSLSAPTVLFISQGETGFQHAMADYYSIGDQRNSKIRKYKILPKYSWGPKKQNFWMFKISDEKFESLILSHKIIWPHRLDSWSEKILIKFINEKECQQNISDYFLIRTKRILKCYAKNQN